MQKVGVQKENTYIATVSAPADVALIKYWGKKDPVLRLPANDSISLTLESLRTTTTVELDFNSTEAEEVDSIFINEVEQPAESRQWKRVHAHLNRIWESVQRGGFVYQAVSKDVKIIFDNLPKNRPLFRVDSSNTFPAGTGLSSSSSAFAALTLAGLHAFGMPEGSISPQKMSILARQGSGSACRCVHGGIVHWHSGTDSTSSVSEEIFPQDWWDLRNVIAVVSNQQKSVSSTDGHSIAQTSPFFKTRVAGIPQKITSLKKAIANKDFMALGELIESEAIEFHTIALTSVPSLLLWFPETVAVFHAVKAMRQEGILAYFTVNTGHNVHIITLPEYQDQVQERVTKIPGITMVLNSKVSSGPVRL